MTLSNLASSSYYALTGSAGAVSLKKAADSVRLHVGPLDRYPKRPIAGGLRGLAADSNTSRRELDASELREAVRREAGSRVFRFRPASKCSADLYGGDPGKLRGSRGALWTNGWRLSAFAAARSGFPSPFATQTLWPSVPAVPGALICSFNSGQTGFWACRLNSPPLP